MNLCNRMEENREGEVEEDKNNYFALTQFVQLTAESFDQFEALIRNIFGLTNVCNLIIFNVNFKG